jgi:hypothetical protein
MQARNGAGPSLKWKIPGQDERNVDDVVPSSQPAAKKRREDRVDQAKMTAPIELDGEGDGISSIVQ